VEYLEALKSLLLGVLSNAAYDKLKGKTDNHQVLSKDGEEESSPNDKDEIKSFPVKSLDAYYGESSNDWFLPLANYIHEPNVYIFIETEPSTFYNLGAVILEDNRTGDWYPFYKSVSFQGTGGGWQNTERLYNSIIKLQESGKKVAVSLRVANNLDTENLKTGVLYWNEFKQRTIPALICEDEFLNKLQKRFFQDLVKIK